jgi:hypothetical protein
MLLVMHASLTQHAGHASPTWSLTLHRCCLHLHALSRSGAWWAHFAWVVNKEAEWRECVCLPQVARTAKMMITQMGFSKKLGQVAWSGGGGPSFLGQSMGQPADCSGQTSDEIDGEVKALVDRAYRCAALFLCGCSGDSLAPTIHCSMRPVCGCKGLHGLALRACCSKEVSLCPSTCICAQASSCSSLSRCHHASPAGVGLHGRSPWCRCAGLGCCDVSTGYVNPFRPTGY